MTDYDSSDDEIFADYFLSNTILGPIVEIHTEASKVQTSADGLLLSSLESTRNLRQPGRATPEVQGGTNGLPLSSLDYTGNLRQLGRATPQVKDGANGLLFSVDGNQANLGMKRDLESVPCHLSVAEGGVTEKQCRRTFFIDESSTLQQPEPKRKELISGKTIKEGAKVLVDRIDRRLTKTYGKVYNMMAMKASQLYPQVFGSLEQIETQWPVLSGLQKVKQNIKEILENHKGRILSEAEAKQKLLQVEKELEQLDQLEEFNGETIEKLYSACSQMKEVGGSLPTRKEIQSKFSELEKEIYPKDNNKVDVEDFLGLQQALDNITGWGRLPNYLEPIAIRIEEARGKATEISQIGSQLLVCAAINETENLLVKDLDLDRLKKWGATLNKAKEHGFQVGFADNLLELKLLAYFATQLLGSGILIG
ncbi:hypothetical protein ES319_D11G378700v1 [Gossypium barbadense]|uniref:Uncharacterized protein n=2 Tax=Gossypium TaxID=3633 RepID=A0A5J5PLD2_GOSBA|nr:hypothetical protein ES319_D11G378700v1 [Gossypium barbadense]TYG48125.1 hypothetical protein ES288_D11G398600v1 [Gossypium darwinii]